MALAKAEEGQNRQNHDDEAHKIDKTVHVTSVRPPPSLKRPSAGIGKVPPADRKKMQSTGRGCDTFRGPARSVHSPTHLPWPDRPAPPYFIHTQSAGKQGLTGQLALFPRRPAARACATRPNSSRRRERNSLAVSRRCRCSRFSSANSKASGGWRRSGFDTTTRCGGCRRPSRSLAGLIRSSDRSRPSAAPATRIAQVLCTEYDVGVGIGWHRDKPHFDRVFGLSLGSACKFRFRQVGRRKMAALYARCRAALALHDVGHPGKSGNTAFPPSRHRDIRSPSARWPIEACARAVA